MKSRNILKAVEYANANGGRTFGICGFGGGKLKNIAHKSLVINTNDMQKAGKENGVKSCFLHFKSPFNFNYT